jgi:hypothetical protein
VGMQKPKRIYQDECPACGGLKSTSAQACILCSPRKKGKRDAQAMDNHHRFEAAVQAGWNERVLIRMRPHIPSWEQIAERCPEAVVKWHPEIVIERWFRNGLERPIRP